MSKRAIALLVGALMTTIMLVAAGCGDDDESLTKAEFVKQGNAICAAGNKELDEGFESFAKEHNLSGNDQPTQAQITEVAETVLIPGVRKQVEKIDALGVPSEDAEGAEEIVDAAQEALEEVEDEPALIAPQAGQKNPFAKANRLARDYGLETCGEE